jgi:hypothetical protein
MFIIIVIVYFVIDSIRKLLDMPSYLQILRSILTAFLHLRHISTVLLNDQWLHVAQRRIKRKFSPYEICISNRHQSMRFVKSRRTRVQYVYSKSDYNFPLLQYKGISMFQLCRVRKRNDNLTVPKEHKMAGKPEWPPKILISDSVYPVAESANRTLMW